MFPSKSFYCVISDIYICVTFSVYDVSVGIQQHFFFFMWKHNCPSTREKTVLFPLISLDTLVKNQLTVNVRVCFWTLASLRLLYICIYPYDITYYPSYCVVAKYGIMKYELLTLLCFIKTVLATQFLAFPYELESDGQFGHKS